MAYPMGEAKLEPPRVDFDRRLKLEFHGRYITFQMSEGVIPRTLFVEILRLVDGQRRRLAAARLSATNQR